MVTTPKKVAANRDNAAKSTGPRTDEGKQRVAQNGVTHGLRSKSIVAPWEQQEDFDAFADRMLACLGPTDELERVLANRIVSEAWRLERLATYEAQVLRAELKCQKSEREERPYEYKGQPEPNAGMVIRSLLAANMLPKLSSYQQRIEGSLYRALHEYEHLLATRPVAKAENPPGQ
jgi:hypothetical protein